MPELPVITHHLAPDRNLYEAGEGMKPHSGYIKPELEDIFEVSLHFLYNNRDQRRGGRLWRGVRRVYIV